MISIVENGNIYEFRGLSTDTKPTQIIGSDGKNQPVVNGSVFFEMDKSEAYMFNSATNTWIKL